MPTSLREIASSYATKCSSFCAGVNDRRLDGPPDRESGLLLLIELSSRTAIKDGLEMIIDS